MSFSCRRHSFSYQSMSITTVPEPLSAGLMIISSRRLRRFRARLSRLVKLSRTLVGLALRLLGLLGKLFQILSLQPFYEIYYDDTSVWTEERSYTFAVSKTVCIPSSGLLFFSVCAECASPNIDILIFPCRS